MTGPPDYCQCHVEEIRCLLDTGNEDSLHIAVWADVKSQLVAATCNVILCWDSVALHHSVALYLLGHSRTLAKVPFFVTEIGGWTDKLDIGLKKIAIKY